MKRKLLAKLSSLIALLIGLQDVLEPIYSFGEYLVYFFIGFNIYLLYLSTQYKTADELIRKEKAFAGLDLFQDFYKQYWRGGVIFIFLVILCVSATGAYYTKVNKDDGGILAKNFTIVKDIQQQLTILIKTQEEIKNLLEEHYKRISLKELVYTLRKVNDPLKELNYVLNNKYIEEPYLPEDVLYLLHLTGKSANYFINNIAQTSIKNCKKNSFTISQILEYIRLLKENTSNGNFNIPLKTILDFKQCLPNSNNINVIFKQLLIDKNNKFFYYQEKSGLTKTVLNICSTPIKKDFFASVIFDKKNKYDLDNFLQDTMEYNSSCISNDSITYLKEKKEYLDINFKEWEEIGITDYKMIKLWKKNHLSPYTLKGWFDLNIKELEQIKLLEKMSVIPFMIKEYIKVNINDINKIIEYIKFDIDGSMAVFFESNSITIKEYKQWMKSIRYDHISNTFIASLIKDWYKIGIKNPEIAKQWTEIGQYMPIMVKEWLDVDIKDPKIAKQWLDAGVNYGGKVNDLRYMGIKSPEIAKQWTEIGQKNIESIKSWISVGIRDPNIVKEWLEAGVLFGNDAEKLIDKGITTPEKAKSYLINRRLH